MTENGKRHSFKKNDLIDEIINMRINMGATRLTILNFLKNDLQLSQSYSYELIRDAWEECNQRAIQNYGEDIKEDIERFERLYEKAMLNNDKKEARECLKEISKLKGHYKERIDLTTNGENINKNIIIYIEKPI